MTIQKPTLYYNNALRDAQQGTDGTDYATCAAGTADAADPFKVIGDITKISDVSALADLVGCQVVFDSTGNRYTITGSGGSNPTAYYNLFERLQDADVGYSFTVQAGLTCKTADPSRPAFFAADGHLAPRFKGTTGNVTTLTAHAPNFIQEGNFDAGFGTWFNSGSTSVVAASGHLDGYKCVKFAFGGSGQIGRAGSGKLTKGKTYRVIYQAKADGTTLADVFSLNIRAGSSFPISTGQPFTSGVITSSVSWKGIEFVPDHDFSEWYFDITANIASKGTATLAYIGNFYIYEKFTVNSLIIGQHNFNLAEADVSLVVNAWNISPLRASATSTGTSTLQLYSDDVEAGLDTFTPTITATSSYPIMQILVYPDSWTPEAGEIYLGDSWQLPRFCQPTDPYATDDGRLRTLKLDFKNLPAAYRKLQIEDLFERLRSGEAIWAQWDTDPPLLMEDADAAKSAAYNPFRVDLSLNLIERL